MGSALLKGWLGHGVRSVVRERAEPADAVVPDDAPVFRTLDAIHDALEAELGSDDRVMVAGIDVGDGGNEQVG